MTRALPSSEGDSSSPAGGDDPGAEATLGWRRLCLLTCVSAGSLVAGCCTLIQAPFFPHEARRRGFSNAASSGVFSCFALSEMLSFPLMGWLAPRLGVTRLYQLGLVCAGLTTVGFGLLVFLPDPMAFLSASFVVRIAEATGTAATQTAARTIVASQFPGRLNTAMGAVETMTGAGLCLGPALGGALYAVGGYGLPFYVLGGLHLMIASVGMLIMPTVDEAKHKSEQEKEVEQSHSQRSYAHLLSLVLCTPDNWLCFSVLLMDSINWTAIDPNLESHVHKALDLSPAQLGLYFLASFTAYTLSSPVWGRISDAIDNTFLLLAGCLAFTALGVLLIPPVPLLGLEPSRTVLVAGMVLRELFLAGAYLPLLGLMLRCSVARGLRNDVHGQAVVAGVFGVVYSVGSITGPLSGGLMADFFGFPILCTWLGAATAVLCLVVAVRGVVFWCHPLPSQSYTQPDD